MIFQDMDRIVFAGDSVTDMGSQNPVGEGLFDSIGHSYVRVIENLLAALYPEVHLRVTNSGISGDNSQMLLARWERDVRALDPQWVSICIGINVRQPGHQGADHFSGGLPRERPQNDPHGKAPCQGHFPHDALLHGAERERLHARENGRIRRDLQGAG